MGPQINVGRESLVGLINLRVEMARESLSQDTARFAYGGLKGVIASSGAHPLWRLLGFFRDNSLIIKVNLYMNKADRESWGRVCEVTIWQAVQVALDAPQGSADTRAQLVDGLLQPEDEVPLEIDGRLWARRECRRCGMAILRPLIIIPGQSTAMLDPSKGTCTTDYGKEAMGRYPLWSCEAQDTEKDF
jgi:hypothetical protein